MRALIALMLCLLPGPMLAETAEDILAQARTDCASLEGGTLTTRPEALREVDLTGDGKPEQIVDSRGFDCTTSAGYWSGTAGSLYWVVMGDAVWGLQAQDWTVVDWNGTPILLQWLNGGDCGGAGAQNCVGALVWDDYGQTFMSVDVDSP